MAQTTQLPWPLTSLSPTTHFLVTEPVPLAADDRLYFYADYDLAGATFGQQFPVFAYQLDPDVCTLSPALDLVEVPLVEEPLLDTSVDPSVEIEQSPLGGYGQQVDDVGVNVWEIGDVVPVDDRCGGATVAESVAYPGGEVYVLFWQYEGFGAQVRDFRIYRGRRVPACD
ncbi:MAG: hypothetical protein R3B09_05760 [Nannocystaceae bacterium]